MTIIKKIIKKIVLKIMTKDKLLYHMLDKKIRDSGNLDHDFSCKKTQWHCWLISKDNEISKQYISSNLAKKEDEIHRPISSLKSIVSNMQVKKNLKTFWGQVLFLCPLKECRSLNETIVIPLSPVSVKLYVDTINKSAIPSPFFMFSLGGYLTHNETFNWI